MAQATSTTSPALQTPRPAFMVKVFAGFAAIAALSGLISLAGSMLGQSIVMAGHSDDPKPYEVVIGNDVLSVPGNEIRFERARRDGVAPRLDLYLEWPRMAGYTLASRDSFNLAGGNPLIFFSIEERIMSRDMSGRYEPIYDTIIEHPGRAGPAGLTVHRFVEAAGYTDEMLVVSPKVEDWRFVARCLSGTVADQSIAPCERDIQIGRDLVLTYRFPRELLADWQKLEKSVRDKASTYLASNRNR